MEPIGSIYTEVSDSFQKGIIGGGSIFRCVKAEKHDLGVVLMNEVKRLGNLYGEDRGLDLLEMFGIKTVSHRLLQLCREA